jgi:hypothetical protein
MNPITKPDRFTALTLPWRPLRLGNRQYRGRDAGPRFGQRREEHDELEAPLGSQVAVIDPEPVAMVLRSDEGVIGARLGIRGMDLNPKHLLAGGYVRHLKGAPFAQAGLRYVDSTGGFPDNLENRAGEESYFLVAGLYGTERDSELVCLTGLSQAVSCPCRMHHRLSGSSRANPSPVSPAFPAMAHRGRTLRPGRR